MLIPTITIHISGTVLAVYGAILSTITAAVQIVTHMRDRAHIKIRVQQNMMVIGDIRYSAKQRFTHVHVSNAGRRPVTITGVSAYQLDTVWAFAILESYPAMPCELTEGKYLTAKFDQKDVDLQLIEGYEVWTATGNIIHYYVAPWWRRGLSWYRRKRKLRQERKAKQKKGTTNPGQL